LSDSEALVRGACAWALGKVGGEVATKALVERQSVEADESVRGEIEMALGESGS